ncbi:SusC/RagA family TonB-linked outer membrane protein [Parapedobacter sp. SGR-10]|uniref:SusC/RagA family TonB-linked outer membrane protein n=1 Tax=Parapedobacter sp. SGR-10 TaxID=2710879 RepID=UPI00197F83F6|nr:SusC/RagA family TonB-linked outer membrane protein [Parapedobacter sp. SGR-10]
MNRYNYPLLLLLCLLSWQMVWGQQTNRVSGKVLGEDRAPLSGASVKILDKVQSVNTGSSGEFEIVCGPEDVLVFTYLGYEPQQVAVRGRNYLEVVLAMQSSVLEDVVVVGYGIQKRVNVTGAVTSVNYSEQAQSRPATTTAGILAGLSPGLAIQQPSGRPGQEGVMIRVRGVGTLNNAAPLVIVDGFETTIGNVNPDDIASMSILKDAASSAIYGNRAANGVILITTKTGTSKPTVSFNSIVSLNKPQNYVDIISNYADYMSIINESAENIDVALPFSQAMIDLWREKENDPNGIADSGYPNYVAYPNTDWMDAFFNDEIYQRHALSISGASNSTNYLMSMSYMDNPGIMINSGMKKVMLRANVASKVNSWLEVGTKLWGYENSLQMNGLDNAFSFMTRAVPGIYPYHDGKYGWRENPEQSSNSRNNLYFADRVNGMDRTFYTNSTLFADVTLPYSLKYNISLNYIRQNGGYKFNERTLNAFSFRTGNWDYYYEDLEKLFLRVRNDNSRRWTAQSTLSWNRTFAHKHDIAALLGFEALYNNSDNSFVEKNGFLSDKLVELNTVSNMVAITGTQTDFATQSVFGRMQYAYDNRYLLEMNLRYDGSSRFARQSRWGVFPSVSAGWRIDQEAFMANTKIDNLKLRGSWGKLGNHSIGNYDYQATYASGSTYSFGGSLAPGMVASLSNNLLEWETTTMSNIGVELGILKNRLTFETDLYNKVTDGILFRAPVYATVGVKSPPYQNIAEVTNKGMEFTLGWRDKVKDFSYGVSANFTRNWNQVTKYRGRLNAGWVTDENGLRKYETNIGDVATVVGNERRTMEGKLINEYFLLNTYSGDGNYFFNDGSVNPKGGPQDGMIRTEDDMQWLQAMVDAGNEFLPNKTIGKKGIWYGDYIYDDTNGDGVYGDPNDYTFQNVAMTPKYTYGFQLNLGWKDISLSTLWAGAGGHSVYYRFPGINAYSTRADLTIPKEIAYDHYFYDPINPDDPRTNVTSKHGRLTMNYGSEQNGGSNYSNLWLYKADYLKLKNLTLGYTVPRKWIGKIGFQDVRLYVSGENLFTFTKFPGMDPEFTETLQFYSNLSQYSIGLNIKL